MNRLARQIAAIASEHVLRPKVLIAPSRRVGHQWILQAVQAGGIINLDVQTLSALALELAGPAMAAGGLELLSTRAGTILADQILARLRLAGGAGYLTQLEPSLALSTSVFQSLQAVRLAGLGPADLRQGQYESPAKGGELVHILELYVQELTARKRIDHAGVLELARAGVAGKPVTKGPPPMFLVPGDLPLGTLERRLLEALPPEQVVRLAVDEPAVARDGEPLTDAALLGWINSPLDAPASPGDGSVTIFHAVGAVNEIRHVLRTCLQRGIPLDDVELLYTDAQTYLPLVYELVLGLTDADAPTSPRADDEACRSALFDDGKSPSEANSTCAPTPPLQLPATFVDGIPVRYSRPGRALAAWLSWLEQGCPQTTLVRMVQDGLLATEEGDDKPSFARLAILLRSVPIGLGQDRYLKMVRDEIRACQEELNAPPAADENGQTDPAAAERTQRKLADLECLARLLTNLLSCCPKAGASQKDVLLAAGDFLQKAARSAGYLDYLSRDRLAEDAREMAALVSDEQSTGLDAWEFLEDLVRQARVAGSSSRPGCLHVASVANGGHTGRGHTFIVGLNDHLFPGSGLQDPVLLDAERQRLSESLQTAAADLHERVEGFARLLARLRGNVTLSFCSHDLEDGREAFASASVVSAYRILTGNRQGDQSQLMSWLPPPVSFVPETPEGALSVNEWWMERTTGPDATPEARRETLSQFAHLARGADAAAARASEHFTPFDGRVDAAGESCDLTGTDSSAVSPSALETLGHCPLRYFFRYALHLRKPDDLEVDTTQWLDALHNGLLLHEVFCTFMRELVAGGRVPVFARDEARLNQILQDQIDFYRRTNPPPNADAYQRRCRELRQACNIFLREEEEYCRTHTPLFMEVTIGLKDAGSGAGVPPASGVGVSPARSTGILPVALPLSSVPAGETPAIRADKPNGPLPGMSTPQTAMDSPDPVAVALEGGKSIRVWGRLDRVDRVNGPGDEFVVWDYKTGGASSYRTSPPFNQGRVLQHFLYMEVAAARLRKLYGAARVRTSGYFLPSYRGVGERIAYTPAQLEVGRAIVADLCRLAADGAFLATDDAGDCRICDFQPICGDCDAVANAAKIKMTDPTGLLDAYRRLRGENGSES